MNPDQYTFWVYTGYFISVILFSVLINNILLRFIKTLGVRDNESLVRWASKKKPAVGGITFFIAFLFSAGSFGVFFDPSDVFKNSQVLGVIVFASVAFIMGLADDAYDTKPILKFGVQILCAAGCVATDMVITLFDNEALNIAITVFWIVGIMNSINMLDNMDGITGSVSVFICLNLLLVMNSVAMSDTFDFYLTLGVLGALIAFLFFNWHPSKMYMGDTGSQFLGFFLGAMAIKYFWNAGDYMPQIGNAREFLMGILVFLLPLTDTTTVFISRIASGKSPFVGGKDHTTHNLSYAGLSDTQVGFVFTGISTLTLLGVFILISFPQEWNPIYTTGFSVFILSIFIGLSVYSIRNNIKRNHDRKN